MQIIPPTGYSVDAANRQITLHGPWAHLHKANLKKVFNFTTNDLLFDPDNRARLGVSMVGGVITFDTTTGMISDTDDILILVEADMPSVDQRVQAGDLYRNAVKMDIASDSSAYLLIKVGTKDLHINFDIAVDGDTQVEIYLSPTVSANGTREYSGNFNFNYITRVAEAELYRDPTVTNEGVYLANVWAFGGAGTNVWGTNPATATRASVSTTPTEVVLTANTDYLLKINNFSGRLLQAFYVSSFHEEEPPEP